MLVTVNASCSDRRSFDTVQSLSTLPPNYDIRVMCKVYYDVTYSECELFRSQKLQYRHTVHTISQRFLKYGQRRHRLGFRLIIAQLIRSVVRKKSYLSNKLVENIKLYEKQPLKSCRDLQPECQKASLSRELIQHKHCPCPMYKLIVSL